MQATIQDSAHACKPKENPRRRAGRRRVYQARDDISTRRAHDSKTRKELRFSWVWRAKGKAFRLPTRVCTRVQAGGLTATATQAVRRTRRREGQKRQAGCARGSSAAAPAGIRLDSKVGTQATVFARRRGAVKPGVKARQNRGLATEQMNGTKASTGTTR
jgi:hypothetical protein